jgi:hypothetical protein
MNKIGLIQKDDDYYVPEIYACYESSKGPGSLEWTKAFHNVQGGDAFRRAHALHEIAA